jgi:nucleoid-associated protein YgaU
MPKDAKLGLVLGVGLVVVIAMVFFRRDPATASGAPEQPAAAVHAAGTPSASPRPRAPGRALKHTVADGETLFSLAQRYYKDGGKFVDIYRANQETLREPDRLEAGVVLTIPDVPE